MELKITQTEYDKIEHLARCAVSAYSKKDANDDILPFIFETPRTIHTMPTRAETINAGIAEPPLKSLN